MIFDHLIFQVDFLGILHVRIFDDIMNFSRLSKFHKLVKRSGFLRNLSTYNY